MGKMGRLFGGGAHVKGGGMSLFGRRGASPCRHHLLNDEESDYAGTSSEVSYRADWKEELEKFQLEQQKLHNATTNGGIKSYPIKPNYQGTDSITNKKVKHPQKQQTLKLTKSRDSGVDHSMETDEETLSRSQISDEKRRSTSEIKRTLTPVIQVGRNGSPIDGNDVEITFSVDEEKIDRGTKETLYETKEDNSTPEKISKIVKEECVKSDSPRNVTDTDVYEHEKEKRKMDSKVAKRNNKSEDTPNRPKDSPQIFRKSPKDPKDKNIEHVRRTSETKKKGPDNIVETSPKIGSRKTDSTNSKNSGLVDSKRLGEETVQVEKPSVINEIGRAIMECSPMTGDGDRKKVNSMSEVNEDEEEAPLFGESITSSVASMVQRLSQTLNCGTATPNAFKQKDEENGVYLAEAVPLGPPMEILARLPPTGEDESMGDITDYTAEASFAMKALRGKASPELLARFAQGANGGATLATLTNPYSGKSCGNDQRELRYFTDYDELGQASLMRGYFHNTSRGNANSNTTPPAKTQS